MNIFFLNEGKKRRRENNDTFGKGVAKNGVSGVSPQINE